VRTVYDQSVTHLICKDIRERAERVARLLNSRFAGIDVITLDPALPLEESGGVINEINTNPGLHHHYVCGDEDSTPALSVLSYLLKKSHE
jgi:D-alanine-D-alanine ligase-like ATP-grasp enzyme